MTPHGTELFDVHDPARAEVIAQVRLADAEDARRAIQAAKRAFPTYAMTAKVERLELLRSLRDAMRTKATELEEATILEYGAPVTRARWGARHAAEAFLEAKAVLGAAGTVLPKGV